VKSRKWQEGEEQKMDIAKIFWKKEFYKAQLLTFPHI
jgi:hypothetical protein